MECKDVTFTIGKRNSVQQRSGGKMSKIPSEKYKGHTAANWVKKLNNWLVLETNLIKVLKPTLPLPITTLLKITTSDKSHNPSTNLTKISIKYFQESILQH